MDIAGGLMVTTLHTTDATRWSAVLSTLFPPLSVHPLEPGFRASLSFAGLGELRLFQTTMPASELRRIPGSWLATPPDHVQFILQRDGTSLVSQAGRLAALEAGDVTLVEPSSPCRVTFGHGSRSVAVVVPRVAIALSTAELSRLTAVRVAAETPSAASTSSLVSSLVSRLDAVSPRAAAPLAGALRELLACVLGDIRDAAGAKPPLVAEIRAHVERRLGDPALTPGAVAAAHHLSVRSLHRLFEAEDTSVGELIRRRRLDRCHADLADPDLSHLSIADVAARWGIVDPSRFSHLFRAAYGRSPSRHRADALAQPTRR